MIFLTYDVGFNQRFQAAAGRFVFVCVGHAPCRISLLYMNMRYLMNST
jgi:hypothetical protein